MAGEVEARDEWIFEGGLSATYPNRSARAEVIVWLDVGLALRIWRVFGRALRYRGETRPDLPEGCPEQLGPEFIELIRYMVRFRKINDRRFAALGVENPGKFVHLKGKRAARRWLAERVRNG